MKYFNLLIVPIVLLSCTSQEIVDIARYPIIMTARDLHEYYDIRLDLSGSAEESEITRYFDGSVELEYTYDLIETKKFLPLFYSITVSVDPKASDTWNNYKVAKASMLMTNKAIGQGTVEIDSLYLPGDENYYALRTNKQNEPVGLFFMMRKENFMYTLIMSGLYATDHSIILDLVLPQVRNIEEFRLNENE